MNKPATPQKPSRAPKVSKTAKQPTAKQPKADPYSLTKHVFLIGFMGAGKSTVARKLARSIGLSSVDMDIYLERREGKTIKDIFAESGEEAFRAIETDVLRELIAKEPLIISCGGGVVTRPENRKLLHENGFVINLNVDVMEASERISNKSSRPLFQDLEAAQALAETRRPLYEEAAHITIDTAHKSVGAITYSVRSTLEKKGILCPPQK